MDVDLSLRADLKHSSSRSGFTHHGRSARLRAGNKPENNPGVRAKGRVPVNASGSNAVTAMHGPPIV